MGGPLSNYRLGKIVHREYEAGASRYWGQDIGRGGESGLVEKAALVLGWSGEGLQRLWCSVTQLGVSPEGCQAPG